MIQSNYSAMTAIANISNTNSLLEKSLQRLTTGKRINSASDDVSGLAIADKLRTQSSSLSMSITNANNAKAMIKIADGAMKETSDSLDLIKTKLIKAASSTTSDEGRESIRKDIAKLLKSIDETAKNTTYNGMQLLAKADGSATDALNFQIGETSSSVVSTDGGVRANSEGLGLDALRDLAADGLTVSGAQTYIDTIDTAISTLSGWKSDFGSTQNSLESRIRNMTTTVTNLNAARDQIMNLDFEQESSNFSKLQIQAQAGLFALSQANVIQQNVLRLLQ
jgi:flagellin